MFHLMCHQSLMSIYKKSKHNPLHIGLFEVFDNLGTVVYRLVCHYIIYIPFCVPCIYNEKVPRDGEYIIK